MGINNKKGKALYIISTGVMIFCLSAHMVFATNYLLDYKYTAYSAEVDVNLYGNSWTPTTTPLTKIRVYLDEIATTTATNIHMTICRGTPDPTDTLEIGECQTGDTKLYNFIINDAFDEIDNTHHEIFLPTPLNLATGTMHYWLLAENTGDNIEDFAYNANDVGMLGYDIGVGLQNTYDSWGWNFNTYYSTEYEYDESDVEILELSDTGDVWISVVAEQFMADRHNICYIDEPCTINYYYGINEIGADLYFLEYGEEDLLNYIEYEVLPDQQYLKGTSTPTIRSYIVTDNYAYFIVPLTGSSTLFAPVQVEWQSSTTEENILLKGIVTMFKNVFPLTIIYQVTSIFKALDEEFSDHNSTEFGITLSDLVDDNWDDNITATTSLLSSVYLEENVPIWYNYIYPYMEKFVYFVGSIYIIILVLISFKGLGLDISNSKET